MDRDKVKLGGWITVPHPTIVDILCDTGLDWLCVDLEHSPVSRLELQTALTIIQGRGKKAFVRVNCNTHSEIKFALDAGPDGIIVPMVNSYEDAQLAIENSYYPPKGKRGVGLARAQKYGFGFEQHLKQNLEELELFVQIEHIRGVQEIEKILNLEDITGVFLGPYDLSGSMGIPGQLTHPRMMEAIDLVAEKTLRSGKMLGLHVIKPEYEKLLAGIKKGYRFIAFSFDTFFLKQKIDEELQAFTKCLTAETESELKNQQS